MKPLFSIVIASYNKGDFIEQTLNSILGQTFQKFEVIIIDDASTDDSRRIIEEYCKKHSSFRLISLDVNRGANFCRNRGIELAQGDYLLFLDADDLLSDKALQNRWRLISTNPKSQIWVFSMGVFKSKIGDDNRIWHPTSKHPLRDFLSHRLPWTIMQPVWQLRSLKEFGGFDESFQRLQDVELHTRVLLSEGFNYYLAPGTPDCFYRIDEKRVSFSKEEYYGRWVNSSVQYYNKFKKLTEPKFQNCLLGTIFQCYISILLGYRRKEISEFSFKRLEKRLLFSESINISSFKKQVFLIVRVYNLNLPRIPGLNRILKMVIIN